MNALHQYCAEHADKFTYWNAWASGLLCGVVAMFLLAMWDQHKS